MRFIVGLVAGALACGVSIGFSLAGDLPDPKPPADPVFSQPDVIAFTCPQGTSPYDNCVDKGRGLKKRAKGCKDGQGVDQGIKMTFWACSDKKWEVSGMTAGKKNGPLVAWTSEGKLAGVGNNTNGVLDGRYVTWRDSGTKQSDFNYKGGVQDGRQREWDESGKLTTDVEMRGGAITKTYLQ